MHCPVISCKNLYTVSLLCHEVPWRYTLRRVLIHLVMGLRCISMGQRMQSLLWASRIVKGLLVRMCHGMWARFVRPAATQLLSQA